MTTQATQTEALHKNLLTEITRFKKDLAAKIRQLPGNGIGFSIDKPCVFIIPFSKLENKRCLCASYYNFKHQYELIALIIEKTPIERIERAIVEIYKSSFYHDDVKKYVRNLWEGLQ